MNNSIEFLNDDELNKLDKYKGMTLIKAINECNTYVQNGALIVLADKVNDKVSVVSRTTESLFFVMDYVNNCSIPREALIEILFNLFQTIEDKDLDPSKEEFRVISFTIRTLHHLLLANTTTKIFTCKKGFIPTSPINDAEIIKIKRGDILYQFDKGNFEKDRKEYHLNVFYDVFNGNWYYLTDDEIQYLKDEGNKI